MGYLPTARAQVKDDTLGNVVPDSSQLPAAHTDFMKLANAIESKMVLRLPSIAQALTAPYSIGPLQDGMLVVTTSAPYEVYVRVNATWQKIYPKIYSGTVAPTAAIGNADDDIYLMY